MRKETANRLRRKLSFFNNQRFCLSPLPWGSSARWAPVARSHRGFSVMSVIVAAGLMGGLALMLVQMTKQQHQTQKKAETGVEITALQQRILRTLYDDKACVNSIGAGRALPSGGTITVNAIKSKNNQDVVVTGGIYGNRLVKIESMTIEVDSFGSGSTQAQAELAVVMGRENRAYTGQKTLTKTFPLTLELDGAGKLAGCVSNAGAVTQGVCTSLGGKWNGSACTLTMAEIGSECPGSTILKGFDSTGAKLCATAVKDMNCPDGEKVVGFAGGVPVCGETEVACPAGYIDVAKNPEYFRDKHGTARLAAIDCKKGKHFKTFRNTEWNGPGNKCGLHETEVFCPGGPTGIACLRTGTKPIYSYNCYGTKKYTLHPDKILIPW